MQKPTESELTILHLLWKLGPSTVREINEVLNEARGGQSISEVGYTTTLKIMQIMFEKGLIDRVEDGRTHRYNALAGEQDTKKLLLKNFVDTAFRGSAMELVLQALGNHKASVGELEQIKAMIASIEKEQAKD